MIASHSFQRRCMNLALWISLKDLSVNPFLSPRCNPTPSIQSRLAGHSKWANIKFKKMHKDNARSKLFAKIAMEIIAAVRETGPELEQNPKLQSIITRAKAADMPKDKIEQSIKNATRDTDEKRTPLILQARGPGQCGLMIDVLAVNALRCRHELTKILMKNGGSMSEDASVAFMFQHKGVVKVEDQMSKGDQVAALDEAEDVAIMIGAESVTMCDDVELERDVIRFICEPLETHAMHKQLINEYNMKVLSAEAQYIAHSLCELNDEQTENADKLIDLISDHPDVLHVYDNIIGYQSRTIKLPPEYVT